VVDGRGHAYSVLLRPEQGLLAATVVPAMLWLVWRRGKTAPLAVAGRNAGCARCRLRGASAGAVVGAELANVSCSPAARAALCDRPGEDVPLGFQRWYRTWAIDFASTEEVYWNYDSAPIDIGDLPARTFDSNEQYAPGLKRF